MIKKLVRLIGIFLFACVLGLGVVTAQTTPPQAILEELQLFSKAIGAIKYAYVEEVKVRDLFYNAIRGITERLDRFSMFISPEQFEHLQTSIKGEYAGIGISLEQQDGYPVVAKMLEGGNAQQAGLLVGDRIVSVEQRDTFEVSLHEVSNWIRGEEGTWVLLFIAREGYEEELTFNVQRQKIEVPAIRDVRIVGRAVGYIHITNFQENTSDQFDGALKALHEQGMEALIIDLRNNDGGLMPEAVELAERFLPKGKKIVSVMSKVPEQRKEYVSSGESVEEAYPLVILVNQLSASASEIFSAAMQDHRRAVLVGMKTFGKASVQPVVPLDDQSAMKFTTARYLSPAGRSIDGIGLQPDRVIENLPPSEPNSDQQVFTALDLLKDYYK